MSQPVGIPANIQRIRKYFSANRHPVMPVSGTLALAKYYITWFQSSQPGCNAIVDELPWITFEARAFLRGIIKPHMRVFEFGTGGSSLYFAKNTKEVIGVEHNGEWYDKVVRVTQQKGYRNFRGMFVPPVLLAEPSGNPNYSDPDSYLSSDDNFLNRFTFRNYASAIDQFEDAYFDVVSVDGRARPSCIKHAISKIKPGGYLMLDNSDRGYYVAMLQKELSGFEKIFERFGPGPYNEAFWGTTFYQKK